MRRARQILRWSVTSLFALSLLPVINLNIERLAEVKGWDQILSERWDAIISAVASIAENPWFLVVLGVALGGTLFMWIDYFLRRNATAPAELRHVSELDVVANKVFEATSLQIDGRRFINCTFKDTLIQWEGSEFRMEGCDLSQGNHFVTHDRQNQVMLELAKKLGLISEAGFKHLRGNTAEAIMRGKEPNLKPRTEEEGD